MSVFRVFFPQGATEAAEQAVSEGLQGPPEESHLFARGGSASTILQ